MMPSPLAPISITTSLPELFKEFEQLKMRLRSSRHPSEPQGFQDQCQIFQEWARRDFSASFSLKALHDVEKVITKLHKANQLSKVQYESFFSYFKNLRALRDQHQRVDKQANQVRCFKEKQSKTSTYIQQLVDEGLATEDRIKVATSENQKLEEQLDVMKVEQVTLLSKLHQQVEKVKKANLEMEDAESQLSNNNNVLVEPTKIFTIMLTYYSRIITLGEDVNLLGYGHCNFSFYEMK
ncbi:TMV resistance protein N-like [Pyrus ussuriensis x Pyrus communis]|uniref:TMV resistance protein N-like n=1 Tax=Pyrus ussuriensis x Pyrus communis TaxID=2448454 RepID=A0A5N5HRP9_9ROSA|nr:TMV resistance protein N-like [Pyrus ussuriensis x Pyrus communis]